jgi:glycosyltransferase involved in cell wall biosynthesis
VQSIVWDAVVQRTAPDHVMRLDNESNLRTLGLAIEGHQLQNSAGTGTLQHPPLTRPLLAFVSPLPGARSGIADYAKDLIPALNTWYEVELVVEQDAPVSEAFCGKFVIRTPQEFVANKRRYARVIYQMGNSQFHRHMFSLVAQVPGIVVLHDFFLGDILNSMEHLGCPPFAFKRAAYHAHGYGALLATQSAPYNAQGLIDWPANLGVLECATGLLVHSEHAKSLVYQWAGGELASRTQVLPLPRSAPATSSRQAARVRLGIDEDTFLVCSMGMMGPTKCNDRLIKAWIDSALGARERCLLVFVGEHDSNLYGQTIREMIGASQARAEVRITGWCDTQSYHDYLEAADLAVQLRIHSRGEMSAAVLDCMNYGVPVIANAHGALSELPKNALNLIPDEFTEAELIAALEYWYDNSAARSLMGQAARTEIEQRHRPQHCANAYHFAIENYYAQAESGLDGVIRRIGCLKAFAPDANILLHMAHAIGQTFATVPTDRQFFLDVSAICRDDLRTGIQRVVRALVWALVKSPPRGFRVEPVYLSDAGQSWHYRYARRWTSGLLELPSDWCEDEVVLAHPGDHLFVADLTSGLAIEAHRAGIYATLRRLGVALHFCIFDLLPIRMPEYFPPATGNFVDWLNTVVQVADSAMCISDAVARDLEHWVADRKPMRLTPLKIDFFHLGADIESSVPTRGFGAAVQTTLAMIAGKTSFLMVGTVEPRKGHAQTFHAFEALWAGGHDCHLIIVGKQGWDGQVTGRPTVAETTQRWRNHPEWGRRLHWLQGITDEELNALYQDCDCLIAASEGEGFGLPLIEAAQHGISIIARDIAVFREVAGHAAFYFNCLDPTDLAHEIKRWIALYERNEAPMCTDMTWLTWHQSATMLLEKLGLVRTTTQ